MMKSVAFGASFVLKNVPYADKLTDDDTRNEVLSTANEAEEESFSQVSLINDRKDLLIMTEYDEYPASDARNYSALDNIIGGFYEALGNAGFKELTEEKLNAAYQTVMKAVDQIFVQKAEAAKLVIDVK